MPTSVVLARCPSYQPEDVAGAVERLFKAGSFARLIPPGGSVLIKPNLLSGRPPERAVTTHPEVVRALVRIVRRLGAEPFIGDSPAGAVKIESVLEKTMFLQLCREEKVRFAVLEGEPVIARNFRGVELKIAGSAIQAGLVINVPKLKTHSLTLLSNAVKNVYGLLPGYQKTLLHGAFANPGQFCECLAYLYSQVKPGLTVCDAVTAMEGNGPSAGTPVHLGLLAASTDGVALDALLCRALGIDPGKVDYLKRLAAAGEGEADPARIETAGDRDALVGARPLRQPFAARAMKLIPGGLVRRLKPLLWIAPSFTRKCILCGRCVEACPAKAISLERSQDGKACGLPRLDRAKCVACCCCHEVCPENAIVMICSPLLALTSCRRILSETSDQAYP